MCRDRVGQLAGVIDSDGGDHRVILQVVREFHVLLEQRYDAAHRPFHIAAGVRWPREQLDHDAVEPLVFLPLDGARAVDALHQHLDVPIRQLEALDDVGDAPHHVDVRGARVVVGGVLLCGEKDPLVLGERMLQGPRG